MTAEQPAHPSCGFSTTNFQQDRRAAQSVTQRGFTTGIHGAAPAPGQPGMDVAAM